MATRIIIDSTADTTEEIRSQLTVVPLTIHFGEEEYLDGVTMNGHQFYEKLIESDVLPTTSQVTPFVFSKVFQEVVDAGDEAVMITISSGLSGTYQSACIAAEDFPGKIYVVDSQNVTIVSGILAEYALRLRDAGKRASEIADILEEKKNEVQLVAMLDTLEYLKKGGRISKTAAVAGSLLSIKPVVALKDGGVAVIGKARGSRQANNMLEQCIEKAGGVDFDMPLLLGYTGINDALLQKYMADSGDMWKDHRDALPTTLIGSVVGTYAGPGAVGVAFFPKKK